MGVIDLTEVKVEDITGAERKTETSDTSPSDNTESSGEKNLTDPKVCHDPSISWEGIARLFTNQNKVDMDNYEISERNTYDSVKLDGIVYPLIVINNRNVENPDIISMKIDYNKFLPEITLKIFDEHCTEQNINSTQMSGMIRVCIISPVDKVYKKILLNFRIVNTILSNANSQIVTYVGEYYVDGFKRVNTQHIWMPIVCPSMPNCGQGAHINANTWEMLHRIAELTQLGFAATKMCKEIPDHIVRHIHTQRFNKYIEQQLLFSGIDKDNIFDAWVDLYGYIVMVNVPWVLSQDIKHNDLTIIANVGLHGTSNDVMDEKPQPVERTLTNYNTMGIRSNMEIQWFNNEVDNKSVNQGTLERIYSVKFKKGLSNVKLDANELQVKQNSIDGEYLEDYNTGKARPIPKFDFNAPEYTGLGCGYDIHKQKRIRTAFFKKLNQSVLYVKLRNTNLGLQRGTLVNISIFDNDPVNKDIIIKNTSRLFKRDNDAQQDNVKFNSEFPKHDMSTDTDIQYPNLKLSGLYYIDGMTFTYSYENGKIDQTLKLLKKGPTSGYLNKHSQIGLPIDEYPGAPTLEQTDVPKNTQTIA